MVKSVIFTSHHLIWWSTISLFTLGFNILSHALLASIAIAAAFAETGSKKINTDESQKSLKDLDSYVHDALTKIKNLRANLVSVHLQFFQVLSKSDLSQNQAVFLIAISFTNTESRVWFYKVIKYT